MGALLIQYENKLLDLPLGLLTRSMFKHWLE